MSYKRGDLQIHAPCPNQSKDGLCDCEDALHENLHDSRGDYSHINSRVAFLPHSCNQWVIGGPDEIRAIISDLMIALDLLKGETR